MRKIEIMTLINFRREVTAINLTYGVKLSLQMQKTYIVAQKIDGFFLKKYNLVIVAI